MSSRAGSRADLRKKDYKVGVDGDEARRKREETLIQIRKNKREENLAKKRRGDMLPEQSYREIMMAKLPNLVNAAKSDNLDFQVEATTHLRKLLSIGSNPPIEEVVRMGLVPLFVEFLTRPLSPQLQFEAAWCLTNIASGNYQHTQAVIEHGAVPVFVQILDSQNEEVREQAAWALSNIAGDNPRFRDLVISHGALTPLLAQLNGKASETMMRSVTWALSNLCRGKPHVAFDLVKPALPAIAQLIQIDDKEIIADACWTLVHLTEGTNDKIQAVIDSGVCDRVIQLLGCSLPIIHCPALRVVGNIVTGDNMQTQIMIDKQVLPCLLQFLRNNSKRSLVMETCWAISNITAGNEQQVQAVIDSNFVPPLVQLLKTAEFEIRKEAAWAISNMTASRSDEQIKYIVDQDCIKPICDLLECSDARVVMVCLEGIDNILAVGPEQTTGLNQYAHLVEEAEGLEKIENLQIHDNEDIYAKVVMILQTYWPQEFVDSEEEDTSVITIEENIKHSEDQLKNPFTFFKFD